MKNYLKRLSILKRSLCTTPGQNGPATNGNEGVLRILQISSITWISPSDCLLSYTGHSLAGVYPSAELQSVNSNASNNFKFDITGWINKTVVKYPKLFATVEAILLDFPNMVYSGFWYAHYLLSKQTMILNICDLLFKLKNLISVSLVWVFFAFYGISAFVS